MAVPDVHELVPAAKEFGRKPEEIKLRHKDTVEPGWYPYPTFANIAVLDQLLKGENRKLARLVGDRPVLDMGAGDGDLAFLFESFGATVHAIDHPAINYNRMTGLHTLKKALGSSIDIQTLDLDTQFALAEQVYGVVFLFGVLYHLKNPFYVLEALARYSEYCLMSTRIARVSGDGQIRIESLPVAYLVAERETNNDPTNYWIFTEPGLRRLLDRAGWEVMEFMTTGCKSDSDPVSAGRDERAFCLLRSRTTDFTRDLQLGDGWYEMEHNIWRWTQKSFSLTIGKPVGSGTLEVTFFFFLPELIFEKVRHVTVSASVNGVALEKHVYRSPGQQTYSEKIPAPALRHDRLQIQFKVDEAFSFGEDPRELGVLVNFNVRCPIALSLS